jgi:hypothetical protein
LEGGWLSVSSNRSQILIDIWGLLSQANNSSYYLCFGTFWREKGPNWIIKL